MKSHERAWQAATFGGFQLLGTQLGEVRFCPVCGACVNRRIGFNAALRYLLENLVPRQPPNEKTSVYGLAASLLVSWARSNLPAHLGTIADLPIAIGPVDAGSRDDWRNLGQELRVRRQRAQLSVQQLSTLSGLAHATIKNLESAKHKPRAKTVRRLRAVPVLWSEGPGVAGAACGD